MASEKLPWGLDTKGLAPGSMKNLSENKLKAFNIGGMNLKKGVTKKEQDDIRKKREQEEAAKVYEEFVESFDDSQKGLTKAWVKGGVVNSEKGETSADRAGSKIYKPTSKLLEKKLAKEESSRSSKQKEEDRPTRPNKPTPTPQRLWTPTPMPVETSKKKVAAFAAADKRKTNLELFKEELKVIQEERQERKKVKQELGLIEDPERKTRFDTPEPVATGSSMGIKAAPGPDDYRMGSYTYDNDVQTTNLYLGNINPKMTELQLCEIFGKFGPLASVKVMWPRSEEEKARGRNCGFVAYMNRKDGERALAHLQGKEIQEFEMKLGWGKPVPIPPHPVYIPPALSEMTLPPPPSGLPFNAQPPRGGRASVRPDKTYGNVPPPSDGSTGGTGMSQSESGPAEDLEKTLANAVVKVVIPTERTLLNVVHRMIEFVIREGPMFEAMIMNRELQNPLFRFLFENQSPAHIYYRWKLFSVLQGDSPFKWRTAEFRMFRGGSIWRPPQMNPYTQGMPDELVDVSGNSETPVSRIPSLLDDLPIKKGAGAGSALTENQRDRLEDMLRDLVPERAKIGDAMIWCLDHADSAEEIVDCIAESMSILQTPIPKKIARLFLISDILHNCSARVAHASFYRKFFEAKLPEIFKDIHEAYEKIDARLKAEQFKHKVMACFRAWEDWAVYTSDFLISLQNIFLGLVALKRSSSPTDDMKDEDVDGVRLEDVDGIPLEDLDGAPLDDSGKLEETKIRASIVPYGDDIDGEPVDGDELSKLKANNKPGLKFIPSKWETVDESELESQAMTVSKWDLLDQKKKEEEELKMKAASQSGNDDDEDIDGMPLDDDDVYITKTERRDTLADAHGDTLSATRDDDSSLTAQQRQEISEEKRAKLREIELKVMKYQDELEAGARTRKSDVSISEQVEQYRRKQLRKEEEKEQDKEREKRREKEIERVKEWERARDRDRDRDRGSKSKNDRGNERSSQRDDDKDRDADKQRSSHRDTDRGRGADDRRQDRNGGDRVRGDTDRDGGSERGSRGGERGSNRESEREQGSRGDSDRRRRDRNDSPSPNRSSGSGLVSYARSRSSSLSEDEKRKLKYKSPRISSKGTTPEKSKRSRSRSPNIHKHKKSKR